VVAVWPTTRTCDGVFGIIARLVELVAKGLTPPPPPVVKSMAHSKPVPPVFTFRTVPAPPIDAKPVPPLEVGKVPVTCEVRFAVPTRLAKLIPSEEVAICWMPVPE